MPKPSYAPTATDSFVSKNSVSKEASLSGVIDAPFSMDQELTEFATWSSDSIWVPPKDSSRELAQSMLQVSTLLNSRQAAWEKLLKENRHRFTHVREIELKNASIRLPKGRVYVTVLDQKNFDKIEDKVPACVQTRLDEFLAGPGKRPGVKVYYLKPLCVEVDHKLLFTTQSELNLAIQKIQSEVFSHYRRGYLGHHAVRSSKFLYNAATWLPRQSVKWLSERKKRAIDLYQAKLEFNRRKAAWRATNVRNRMRTDKCSYESVLSLTKTPDKIDVIDQFVKINELSRSEREAYLRAAAGTLPWFFAASIIVTYASTLTITVAPPIVVCDPVFVAEFPGSRGKLLKIGHFDEIQGVMHVEI